MRRTAFIALLYALLWTGVSRAAPDPSPQTRLKEALGHFHHQRWAKTVSLTSPLIQKLKLHSLDDILLAHQILALSKCELRSLDQARVHAQVLLDFGQLRQSQVKSGRDCTQWLSNYLSPKPPSPPTPRLTYTSRLSALTPMGLPQLDRGQKTLGWSLFWTQTLGLALGLSGYILYKMEQNPDGTVPKGHQADVFRAMNWAGFGGFGLSYGLGTVHAYSTSPR